MLECLPTSEYEQEVRDLLNLYEENRRKKDLIRANHKYPVEIPVVENGIYTPPTGHAIVKYIFHANGYPKAKLIGSLGMGKTSTHDIDILVPLRNKKTKSKCVSHLYELLQPKHVHTLGVERVLFETNPYGNIELFFSTKGFSYGIL